MENQFTVNRATDIALLVARTGVAILMLTHGVPKLMNLISGVPVQFPSVMGMSAELSQVLAVFAEVFCSLLLLAGFATRLATIPPAITMGVAAFVFHANDPFAKQELALIYLLLYAILFIAGSGRFSVDYVLQRRAAKQGYSEQNANADLLYR